MTHIFKIQDHVLESVKLFYLFVYLLKSSKLNQIVQFYIF